MTQRDRVLAALQRAGRTGITQVDFLGPITCDGGAPITRLAARVLELRKAGYGIENNGRRHKCDVYVLTDARGAPVAAPAPATPAPAAMPAHSPVEQDGNDSAPVVVAGQMSLEEALA